MDNHDSAVAEYLITGKNKALKLAKIYTDIDTLRPYFDVEPRTIANRIVQSFIPVTDLSSPEKGDSSISVTGLLFYLQCLLNYMDH